MTETADRPETTADPAPEPVRAAIVDSEDRCVSIALVDAHDPFDPGEGLRVHVFADGEHEPEPGDVRTDGGWEPAQRATAPEPPAPGSLEELQQLVADQQSQIDRLADLVLGAR